MQHAHVPSGIKKPSYTKILAFALGDLAQEEIAEYLNALRIPELLWIHKISIDSRTFNLGEDSDQVRGALDHEFRQGREPQPGLRRPLDRIDIIDREGRAAALLTLGAEAHQEIGIRHRRASRLAIDDDLVVIELLRRLRQAVALDVGGGGIDVEMHRHQMALDQLGL